MTLLSGWRIIPAMVFARTIKISLRSRVSWDKFHCTHFTDSACAVEDPHDWAVNQTQRCNIASLTPPKASLATHLRPFIIQAFLICADLRLVPGVCQLSGQEEDGSDEDAIKFLHFCPVLHQMPDTRGCLTCKTFL